MAPISISCFPQSIGRNEDRARQGKSTESGTAVNMGGTAEAFFRPIKGRREGFFFIPEALARECGPVITRYSVREQGFRRTGEQALTMEENEMKEKMTKELTAYVAELSRIRLDEEETEKMQEELGAVLDYMEILNRLDTEGVEPLSHILGITNVMREDLVKASAAKEDILRNMPETEDGMPVVPRTID